MSDEANSQAWQAAGQAASAGAAAIGQAVGSKKQYERTKDLMDIQQNNQERLNQNAYNRQMQMWKDTNYSAQKAEMEKAGLNVGLMYGQSGGGGSTVGTNSGGSAASGNAPQYQDVGAISQAAKTAAELSMMKAGTEKLQAEARKANVEANVTEFGEQTAKDETTVRSQELTNKEAEIWAEMNAKNKYDEKGQNGWDIIAENEIKNSKSEATKQVNEAILSGLKNNSEVLNQKYTNEKINEIWHSIRQKWTQAGFKGLDSIISAVTKGAGKK